MVTHTHTHTHAAGSRSRVFGAGVGKDPRGGSGQKGILYFYSNQAINFEILLEAHVLSWKPYALEEIINCTLQSNYNSFPKCSITKGKKISEYVS